jgi:hypothetical protein
MQLNQDTYEFTDGISSRKLLPNPEERKRVGDGTGRSFVNTKMLPTGSEESMF